MQEEAQQEVQVEKVLVELGVGVLEVQELQYQMEEQEVEQVVRVVAVQEVAGLVQWYQLEVAPQEELEVQVVLGLEEPEVLEQEVLEELGVGDQGLALNRPGSGAHCLLE